MRTAYFNAIGALLILLLGGCAHQPGQLPAQDWQERYQQLAALPDWQVSGKLGVRIPGDNGSASLHWHQQHSNYSIDLSGPMGSNRFSIKGNDHQVTLLRSGQPPQVAHSAEDLILANTGWTIPVAELAWWVRALPAPDQPIDRQQRDESRQLLSLEQSGWLIEYSNYRVLPHPQHSTPLVMPGRIVASWGDIRLTLVIRDWQFGDTP